MTYQHLCIYNSHEDNVKTDHFKVLLIKEGAARANRARKSESQNTFLGGTSI